MAILENKAEQLRQAINSYNQAKANLAQARESLKDGGDACRRITMKYVNGGYIDREDEIRQIHHITIKLAEDENRKIHEVVGVDFNLADWMEKREEYLSKQDRALAQFTQAACDIQNLTGVDILSQAKTLEKE